MVLEATVICLDNSEWMRNGDYMPTRLEAQQDAVNLITAAKTQQNPESAVGVMTMSNSKSGKAEVLVTLTQDLGKILTSLHGVKVGGEVDFSAAMQVAQLVLKHRQNKNQHKRIVVFVGSPIRESSDDLVKLAKKLKKNNVAVDIVNFGEETHNTEKLEAFLNAVNTGDESHLITIPPGPHILSDILLTSPVVVGEGGGGGFGAAAAAAAAAAAHSGAGGAGAGGNFDFGVDPTLDPELAMALRISMEEERARQEGEAKQKNDQDPKAAPSASVADVEMTDDDELLQQAIAMSMPGAGQPAAQPRSSDMELSEEEQMQMALQMSIQGDAPAAAATAAPTQDQDFLNSVLSTLPGVDPNDERIRNALQNLNKGKEDESKDKK